MCEVPFLDLDGWSCVDLRSYEPGSYDWMLVFSRMSEVHTTGWFWNSMTRSHKNSDQELTPQNNPHLIRGTGL